MRIAELIERSARRAPEGEAVFDGNRRRSWSELVTRGARLASGLASLGLAPGERLAVISKNRAEFCELYYAAARQGAVLVPINWRLRSNEIAEQLADAEVRVVVCEAGFAAALTALAGELSLVALGAAVEGWLDYESLIAGAEPQEPPAAHNEDALLIYTSGTTGRSKAARLTHANVLAMVDIWRAEIDLGPAPDRFLQVTPLFHVGGMLQWMTVASSGASMRLLPEFLPGPALDALEQDAITHALFVPAMVRWLLAEKDVRQRDFAQLRLIVYGAAPMPVAVLIEALEVFGCGFLQGYGLTETSGVLTTLRPEQHRFEGQPPARLASAGRAAGCELRLVDEAGNEVAPGEMGEIIARGPQIGPGYWRREQETHDSWRAGWFHTGDLARLDEEGFVTLVDRSKDMILVAGENVSPSEVEAVLLAHPALSEAAVIGIPHAHWGEEVLALVVARAGQQIDERELIQHCRASLARFKCPTRVEQRDEIPRNAAGKLLKRELREPYWKGHERRV